MNPPTQDMAPPDEFDAELAAVLEELGSRARPHEFDAQAILRRAARIRSCRLLAGSAALLAVAAGASVLVVGPGRGPGEASAAADRPAAVAGVDPLVVPGVFHTMPPGAAAVGFTQFGATGYVAMVGAGSAGYGRMVAANWRAGGATYTAQISWFGDTPALTLPQDAGSPVGTVNGRTAYLGDMPQHQLTFWTGTQGYATVIIYLNGADESAATAEALLGVARSLDPVATAVPMPLRVSGLDSAQITSAGMGDAVPDPGAGRTSWSADLSLLIDGRSYRVDAVPGAAGTPTPTGTETSTGVLTATETVDGVGITVTTPTGRQGSADAPTAAQVLAHVTALGTDPSGWTTSVLTK